MSKKTKAIIYMILSSLSFSMMSLIVRLSSLSCDLMQQVFFRNLIGLVIAAVIMKKEGIPLIADKKYQIPMFLRSLSGYIGVIYLFKANALAAQADVALLSRLSPVFVCIFAYLLLKEKISKVQIPVIILCMIGAAIALNPQFDSDIVPLLYALVPSVTGGIAYTMIALCSGKVHPMSVILHFCVFSTICSGFYVLRDFTLVSGGALCMLVLIGIFAALGQIGLTYAYQNAPSAQVSIYDYVGLIFSAFLGTVVLGEQLKMTTVIGSALIIAGAVWSFVYNNRRA